MPKITDLKIQKNNKTRANLYLDGEFAFGVEMLTVMKLGLKIGTEISEERLKEAIFDSEKSVAFEKSMDYLARGMKTVKQMKDYLTKKGFSAEVTAHVIEKLKDYKYVDDDTYAKLYVEQNSKNKGTRRLQQELLTKGICREKAEEFSALDGETAKTAAETLAAKYMRNKSCEVKNLQKLQRYLIGRGYDFDVVNAIVRRYKNSDWEGDDL